MCNHTSVVYEDKMYLYGGGSSQTEGHQTLYALDLLKNYKWEVVKYKPKDGDAQNLPHCYVTNEMG